MSTVEVEAMSVSTASVFNDVPVYFLTKEAVEAALGHGFEVVESTPTEATSKKNTFYFVVNNYGKVTATYYFKE